MSGAKKRKVCVVTGSRAEYGLLYWVMKGIQSSPVLELQIAITGMHVSPEFGETGKEIEKDGFTIHERIEMNRAGDSPLEITRSLGRGVIGFAEALERLRPDLLLMLGDRYELLAAAQAALIARIPIAHIAGGDTTEGAFDEAIRHSITKMSHLHFVTNEGARKRVLQLGEDPARVFNFGSPGLDTLRKMKLLSRQELERDLGFHFRERNFLVTFHPVTLENASAGPQMDELLSALGARGDDVGLIFTKSNADTDSRAINEKIDAFVKTHSNARAFTSLGQLRYLSVMAQASAVVGNSSSGLYEAPSFRIPTVNIGDRQKGRLQANSVVDASPRAEEISKAIDKALRLDCSQVVNPYGDGHSSEKIVAVLEKTPLFSALIKKRFHEVSAI